MRGGFRNRLRLAVGLVLVISGTWLLAVGIPFVTGWLAIMGQISGIPSGGTGYLCPKTNTFGLVLAPDPYPVLGSYAGAIPAVFGIAWWTRHSPGRQTALEGARHRAALLLMGTMVWMGLFFLIALAMDWQAVPVPPWARLLLLGSLLAAPSIVLGGGAIQVWIEGRRALSRRSRASHG